MALDGFLLDLDGTLLDTSGARVRAWGNALEKHGYTVGHDRISAELATDPDGVVVALLGQECDASRGALVRRAAQAEYERIVMAEGLELTPGTEDLLQDLHRRGIETALAANATDAELDFAERASGVSFRKIVDVVASKSDEPQKKSGALVIAAALARLGMTAAQCAMLGDSRADARAARKAGVVMIGLTIGGADERMLTRSGARLVYRDPAELKQHLEVALRRASPGSARFPRAMLEGLVREALALAEENLQKCRVPTGAVVARGNGVVIARGRDLSDTHGRIAHAELEALRAAAPLIARDAGSLLVSTREPCAMCLAAAIECGIDTVVFARRDARGGGTRFVRPGVGARHELPRVVGGVLADESERLHRRFLQTLEPRRLRGRPRVARAGSRA